VHVEPSKEIIILSDHTNFQNIEHRSNKNDRSDVCSASDRYAIAEAKQQIDHGPLHPPEEPREIYRAAKVENSLVF
jgi:hypothetical protein